MSLSKKDPFAIVGRNPRVGADKPADAELTSNGAPKRAKSVSQGSGDVRTKTINARLSYDSYMRLQEETARLSAEWGHRVFPATVAERWLRRLMDLGVDEAIVKVGSLPMDSELVNGVSFQAPLDVTQWVVVTAATRRTVGSPCSTVRQIVELAARLSEESRDARG